MFVNLAITQTCAWQIFLLVQKWLWDWQVKCVCRAIFAVVAKQTSMLDKQNSKCWSSNACTLGQCFTLTLRISCSVLHNFDPKVKQRYIFFFCACGSWKYIRWSHRDVQVTREARFRHFLLIIWNKRNFMVNWNDCMNKRSLLYAYNNFL